jgi:tetratricopeptide (TPR) repeat protein
MAMPNPKIASPALPEGYPQPAVGFFRRGTSLDILNDPRRPSQRGGGGETKRIRMAKEAEKTETAASAPVYSEAVKANARQWFKRGAQVRDQRNYDYAIESYLTGLEVWPEAAEEGLMPLWSLAIQRQQSGGKKPGMMDSMKKPVNGKDAKQNVLNAWWLLARDPTNVTYLDALLKATVRADYPEACKFITPKVLENMRKEPKPNPARFKLFRQTLIEIADRCDARGDAVSGLWFLEQAAQSLDFLVSRNPTEMSWKEEQRDLSGKLTILKGKYGSADTFRDSMHDGDKQKLLHDAERGKQGEVTLDELIRATREEFEKDRDTPARINAYVEALLKPERRKEEELAIVVLEEAATRLNNYNFKLRADDVRLRQLARTTRQAKAKAAASGSDDDRQQARLAAMEELSSELEIFQERIKKYPTDLRMKYRLAAAMFKNGDFDACIPILQLAQGEPRYRTRAQILLGRAFLEKNNAGQAANVLKEALETFQPTGDDTGKELLYWLGAAYKADGNIDEAKDTLNKLIRQDYNYADGKARRMLEELK